jgi:hypothetical protein
MSSSSFDVAGPTRLLPIVLQNRGQTASSRVVRPRRPVETECLADFALGATVPKLGCRLHGIGVLRKRARPFRSVCAHPSRSDSGPMSSAEAECVCIIFLDSHAPRFQSGCARRSDRGLAHFDRLIEKAVVQQSHRGNKMRTSQGLVDLTTDPVVDLTTGDATGAWGGVVGSGVRPGGGERRATFRWEKSIPQR